MQRNQLLRMAGSGVLLAVLTLGSSVPLAARNPAPEYPALQALPGARSAAELTYRLEPTPDDPEQLECAYTDEQIALLEKLNRRDRENLTKLGELVVPSRWDLEEAAYSPLAAVLDEIKELPKAVLVHQPGQVFGAYEKGELVRWGPVSTGAENSPTPSGVFHLNWKSRSRRSTLNRDWLLRWYFNFVNGRGHAFHEYELPGGAVSHGCVRLLARDARWLFDWGASWELDERGWNVMKPGTAVFIIGRPPYEGPAPWSSPPFRIGDPWTPLEDLEDSLKRLTPAGEVSSEDGSPAGAGTEGETALEAAGTGPQAILVSAD